MADETVPAATVPTLTPSQSEDVMEPLNKAYAVALTLQTSSASDHCATVAEVIVEYIGAAITEVAKLTEVQHG